MIVFAGEDSNLNFCAPMSPLFLFLVTQNLKLKYQNKTIRFYLYYIFFLYIKNIYFLLLFYVNQ
jgi:hypothetical protein